jgi:hypothetical protein
MVEMVAGSCSLQRLHSPHPCGSEAQQQVFHQYFGVSFSRPDSCAHTSSKHSFLVLAPTGDRPPHIYVTTNGRGPANNLRSRLEIDGCPRCHVDGCPRCHDLAGYRSCLIQRACLRQPLVAMKAPINRSPNKINEFRSELSAPFVHHASLRPAANLSSLFAASKTGWVSTSVCSRELISVTLNSPRFPPRVSSLATCSARCWQVESSTGDRE